jgi:hypothetical protein
MRTLNYANRSERLRLGGSITCGFNLTSEYEGAITHIQDVLRKGNYVATRVEIVEMALDAFFILMQMPAPPAVPFKVDRFKTGQPLRVRCRVPAPSRQAMEAAA